MAGILVADTIQVNSILTKAGSAQSASNLGLSGGAGKNMITNGAMQISQRGTSFTPTTALNYSLDRFATLETTDGSMTISQDTSVVPTGFKYSLKAVTGTADSSLAASQRMILLTRIEGYDAAHLELGTANAKQFTLSFYVRSSLTGTFGGAIQNSASDRNYPFTYTINAANTWERKTITITGDTSGTWNTTNGTGLQVCWGLGVGSDYSGTAGAWGSGDKNSATGAVSVIGTASATWYLTGVQVEVGDVASEFEHKKYSDTLLDCYRYFYKITRTDAYGEFLVIRTYSTTQGTGVMILPVSMRAQPTFTSSTVNSTNFSYGMSALGFPGSDHTHRLATHNAVGAFTANGAAVIQKGNNTDPIFMQYDAEL